MPEMSIRISASSSTTRMSCAMAHRVLGARSRHLLNRFVRRAAGRGSRHARLFKRKYEAHPGATAFAILENQPAAVILHDFLNNGEPQSGALGPGRDIGLGQPITIRRGQPFS